MQLYHACVKYSDMTNKLVFLQEYINEKFTYYMYNKCNENQKF